MSNPGLPQPKQPEGTESKTETAPNELNMHDLLHQMISKRASDMHITVGVPPMFRVDGNLVASAFRPLKPNDCQSLAYSVLSEDQRKRFETSNELDVSFGIRGLSRFRANVFVQRGAVSIAIRQIPYEIMTAEKLGLNKTIVGFARKAKGLVLVTGPTGSGKSTTLAALIDLINKERRGHIMTIEDPIEFVHQHGKCIINQREINADTSSFVTALKYVLRQDPDVIMLGEMRDLETIASAITIAETGHLVFATLHTNSAMEAVNRMVDVFPPDQQQQVLSQLSFVLEGIVAQQLLPRARGEGRVLIPEILVCNPAIRAVVREGKTHQIYTLMQVGQKFGMQTMNQALFTAFANKQITYNEAMGRTMDPQELSAMITKSGLKAA